MSELTDRMRRLVRRAGDSTMFGQVGELQRRVAALEAAEAVRRTMADYATMLDAGYVDDLLDVFTEDVDFAAVNYPPGTGGTESHRGRADLRRIYEPLEYGSFRHHVAMPVVTVDDGAERATVQAYFVTGSPFGVGGGLYQGTVVFDGDRWRISRWRVVSSWGWRLAPGAEPWEFHVPLGEGADRAGRLP